jgi:hypothetical protein
MNIKTAAWRERELEICTKYLLESGTPNWVLKRQQLYTHPAVIDM